MAWQAPKVDWAAADGVRDTDMNRIEGNALALYEETARSSRLIYVSTTGNDDTGNGTSANPYATITKALSVVPKNIAGQNVSIYILGGTYAEAVSIKGFSGGVLTLTGASSTVTLDSISIEAAQVVVRSLPLVLTAAVGLVLSEKASFTTTGDVTTDGTSTGVNISGASTARIAGTHRHDGAGYAVVCSGNSLYNAESIAGLGSLHASSGGVISAASSLLNRSATSGGRIYIGSQSDVKVGNLSVDNWSSEAPYIQTISVDGITADDQPIISSGVPATIDADSYKALSKSYGMIDRAVTGDGTITFYCYSKKPTVDIPILIKGV